MKSHIIPCQCEIAQLDVPPPLRVPYQCPVISLQVYLHLFKLIESNRAVAIDIHHFECISNSINWLLLHFLLHVATHASHQQIKVSCFATKNINGSLDSEDPPHKLLPWWNIQSSHQTSHWILYTTCSKAGPDKSIKNTIQRSSLFQSGSPVLMAASHKLAKTIKEATYIFCCGFRF